MSTALAARGAEIQHNRKNRQLCRELSVPFPAALARVTAGTAVDRPCIGSDVFDILSAADRLMDRSDDELSPEARVIARKLAPLIWRCRNLWRDA